MPISNVRRLVNLIREQATVVYEQATDAWDLDTPEYRLAAFLAARGVLAVDSLTDEQAHSLWYRMDAELVRAALRRCATGEAE